MELANKTLIVTGASSGIGAAAARLFASEGQMSFWPRADLMNFNRLPRTSPEAAAASCTVQVMCWMKPMQVR